MGEHDREISGRLDAALTAAGVRLGDVIKREELSGGTFNTVFRVRCADGTGLVVKLAPESTVPVLRHEHGLLASEALVYELVARAGIDVPVPVALSSAGGRDGDVPDVLDAADVPDVRDVPGSDWLVMTECPGENWTEAADRLDERQRRRLRAELGGLVAALHTIAGPGFGYPAEPWGPLRGGWRAAFTDMVDAVLSDADRFGVELPRPSEEIRALFAAQGAVLDEVGSARLVHFDLWDGNILVDGIGRGDGIGSGTGAAGNETGIGAGQLRISGLIDAERAFWGDPIADFVSLALFGDIEDDDAFLDGYRAAGGSVTFDASTRLRLTLYRTYLYLIMWVEAALRGYDEGRRTWLREHVVRPMQATFDGWARG